MNNNTKAILVSIALITPVLASSIPSFAKTTTTTPKNMLYVGMQGKCQLYESPMPKYSTFVKSVKVFDVTVKEEFLKWGNMIEPLKYLTSTVDGHKLELVTQIRSPMVLADTVCPPNIIKIVQHRGMMLLAPKQVLVKK